VPTGQNGTCYRGGLTVFENHQMCNVTSKSTERSRQGNQLISSVIQDRKIIEQLKDQVPQVTFSCDRREETCDFQCKNESYSFEC
jgi:hypothetical protein